MAETKPCTKMFSNGTEFEWFIEQWCERCTKFRKGKCKIFGALCDARFDESKFPYSALLDYVGGYAGKECKSLTDEPQTRKRHNKPIDGQMNLETGVMKNE